MFSKAGHWLGDCWTAVAGGLVHLYFLYCPDSVERHTFWSVGHASSCDLVNWEEHAPVLHSERGDPERGCLATGSVARWGGRHVMALIGSHNSADPRTLLLESDDLHAWRVIPGTGFGIDGRIYTRRGSAAFKNPRWRDPFLIEADGWLYCLMTAAVEAAPADADGVIGVLRTRDLLDWECLPPLRTPPLGTDLECPKLHRIDGRWHLLVSLFDVLQCPAMAARQPAGLNPSTTFSLVADRMEGPYALHGSGRVLGADAPGCPYACEAVNFNGRWHLLGTCWSDRLGDRLSDPVPLAATPQGLRADWA